MFTDVAFVYFAFVLRIILKIQSFRESKNMINVILLD